MNIKWKIIGSILLVIIATSLWLILGSKNTLPIASENNSGNPGEYSVTTSTTPSTTTTTPTSSTTTSTTSSTTTTSPLNANKLSDQELKERIGEMLLIGFRGTSINSDSYITKTLKDVQPGGVILFDYDSPSKSYPRNITSPSQTAKLIKDLKIFSPKSLFVAVDAEGGLVNRLKPSYGFISIPSAASLGLKNDPLYTREIANDLGEQLKNLGFNLNFAPVVDVNINPQNPIIGSLGRSFSSNPSIVTSQAEAFIRGLHDKGIITAIKHFPGHDSSSGDTHKGVVDITTTYKQEELIPFRELIKKGLPDMIMTAHVINKNVDPSRPATLSSLFINDILRKQLGWNGVVVTDDMQMQAITSVYGMSEAAILAIKAGGDILIISNNVNTYDEQAPYKVRDAIFTAVKNGGLSENSIISSSNRIRALKNKFGIN